MQKLKNLIKILISLAILASTPVVMDHARDVYLAEVVAKKANPVKIYNGTRTIGSSFQIKYKGKRVTVTNNHVCQVAVNIAKAANSVKKEVHVNGVAVTIKYSEKIQPEEVYLTIGNLKRKILYISKVHDICFLEPMGNKYFRLANDVHRGERVTIIGHPRGMEQSMSDGRMVGSGSSSFPWLPEAGVVRYYRSTALAYPGNSGSPVVNRYGNVVGILFAGVSTDYANINFVVPLEALQSELESFLD